MNPNFVENTPPDYEPELVDLCSDDDIHRDEKHSYEIGATAIRKILYFSFFAIIFCFGLSYLEFLNIYIDMFRYE